MSRVGLPRASYVKAGAVKVASKKSSAVAYLCDIAGTARCYAVGFYGKAEKPSFNYSFKDAEKRAKWVAAWFVKMDGWAEYKASSKASAKAALAAPHGLKVDDVLVCMWGYDQTNVDYFQIVELVGKRSVKIRPIGCERLETLSMQGESVPAVGAFKGEPMLKKVLVGDRVRIYSFATASKLEPIMVAGKACGYKPTHWTAYA